MHPIQSRPMLYRFLARQCLLTDNLLSMEVIRYPLFYENLAALMAHLPLPEIRSLCLGVEKEIGFLQLELKNQIIEVHVHHHHFRIPKPKWILALIHRKENKNH